MQMVGNNIRERRVRLRRTSAKAVNKNSVPVAGGVSVDSWNAIFDSLSNPTYQAKSDKCKVAADERTRRKGFTHKLGSKGVFGLVAVFKDEFGRSPTEEEVHFAKQNGIHAAIEHVRHGNTSVQMQAAVPITKPPTSKKKKRQPAQQVDSEEETNRDSSGDEGDESDIDEEASGLDGSGSDSSGEESRSESEDLGADRENDPDKEVKVDDEDEKQRPQHSSPSVSADS